MKTRILISSSARVKGAWLADSLTGCWRVWGQISVSWWRRRNHTSFIFKSFFFFKATVCVLVYAGNVMLPWKSTVTDWSCQAGRKGKTRKFEIYRNGVSLFPIWAKTEISSLKKRLRHKRQTQNLTSESFKKSDMTCYDTETRYTNSQTSVFTD